ncbi:MAG TPA: DUF452 family protein [Bacteroidales bacterium]|nr:DUF452 family protein [Bacteroidales bacterium]HRS19682.1 DUF452 family protein [Bacteroidales bacterium]
MNIEQIHTIQGATECLLFFNGWGMDTNAIQHITNRNYDIFACNNYTDLTVDFSIIENYSKVHIVAWSMGVWACMNVQSKLPKTIASSIAINGTELPMHDTMGIPSTIFKGTIEAWNDNTRTKFNIRMCGSREEWIQYKPYMSKRISTEQKEELEEIHSHILLNKNSTPFNWTSVVIGERDLIFTAENQKNYWQSHIKRFILPIPHYPFGNITTWDEILNWAK